MRLSLCLFTALLAAQTTEPFQNDQVIVNAPHPNVDVPGSAHQAHEHKLNRVMIYLHEGGESLHYLKDGKTVDLKWHAGEVLWSPASGMHYSEMKPGVPAYTGPMVVDIGVKKPGDPAKAKLAALDPLKVDAKQFRLEFQNPQVRVLRLKLGPREVTPMVESNLDRLMVYITDANIRETPDGGEPQQLTLKRAEYTWEIPSKSKIENLSDKPFEAVIVEFRS